MKVNFLLENIFRASSSYQLLELGQLSRPEQQALTGLITDAEVFGVFKPVVTNSYDSYKVAYKDVALLFYSLKQPGALPFFIQNAFDDDVNQMLARLIIDGIFEIKSGEEFVSGVNARKLIFKNQTPNNHVNLSHIAALSKKAIQYVLHLNHFDIRTLSTRLYCYNTMPCLEQQYVGLCTANEVEQFLGIGNGNSFDWMVLKNWDKHLPTENYNWLMWLCRKSLNNVINKLTYKMYISPVVHALPKVFRESIYVLTKTKSFCFKVGCDTLGLLRPDKFVAYFQSFNDLLEAASLLQSVLKGFEGQGVPFTAQLDNKGLLSWGVDPPRKEVLENFEGVSWRTSVTEKIASAVIQAKTTLLEKSDSYDFVLNKISLEGIDPLTWAPQLKNLEINHIS